MVKDDETLAVFGTEKSMHIVARGEGLIYQISDVYNKYKNKTLKIKLTLEKKKIHSRVYKHLIPVDYGDQD